MKKSVLIIDDVQEQAESLQTFLSQHLASDYSLDVAFKEDDIINKVENSYYSLVLLDLRMDKYKIDGIKLAQKIIDSNTFARIIIVSAYTAEFFSHINALLPSGKILKVIEKKSFLEFAEEIRSSIDEYHDTMFSSFSSIQSTLLDSYAQCKNENDSYKKGIKFEHFVTILFNNMGFDTINKRVIDKSRNEVDLVIRNDIEDSFLNKFGKYFLIECKNMPTDGVDKNMFIQFKSKLDNTGSMSELGIIATTGNFKKTTYQEAIRASKDSNKILFISNPDFETLIKSENRLEAFKRLIDAQTKDN